MMLMAELQNVGDTYYRYIWVGILEGQGKSLLVEDSWKYKKEIQNENIKKACRLETVGVQMQCLPCRSLQPTS